MNCPYRRLKYIQKTTASQREVAHLIRTSHRSALPEGHACRAR